MSDKARGALFNVLGDIDGLTVLDAFAGSGALSFEAISRGAASAVAIDSDRTAQKVIAANVRTLGLTKHIKCISASANAWLQTSPEELCFDLVFCDPPYNDLQVPLIARLAARVKPDGLLVLSWPTATDIPQHESLVEVEHREYGDASLIFYRRT